MPDIKLEVITYTVPRNHNPVLVSYLVMAGNKALSQGQASVEITDKDTLNKMLEMVQEALEMSLLGESSTKKDDTYSPPIPTIGTR